MREMQAGSQRDALGRAGRAAFLEHWSERTVLPRYLSVIQDAAAARGATHVLDALGTARPA